MKDLEPVGYSDGETSLTGWLVRPADKPRGAFVIYPTIANVTPAIERRAHMMAAAGFVALIADFYGCPVQDFAAAGALADTLRADTDRYRSRLSAAIDALRGHPAASGLTIAAMGYCMGGQAALEMARAGQDLALLASFHGILSTGRRAAGNSISSRVLVCHGDADPLVPREHVIAFWEEMSAAGADWHFHTYGGVKHGFTDPGSDARGLPAIAYDSSADTQSWLAFMALCEEIFVW